MCEMPQCEGETATWMPSSMCKMPSSLSLETTNLSRKTNVPSIYDEPFNSTSLASSEESGGHFLVRADTGNQKERAPMLTRGRFWESWAPSLLNDSKCLRVDCCRGSWVSHLAVIPLSDC